MISFKGILAGGAALAGLALALPAHATLDCSIAVDGVTVATCTTSNTGSINQSFADPPLFSTLSLLVSGFPAITNPNLSTTTLDVSSAATFTGTHTVTVDVFQSGLPVTPAGTTLNTTFTINHLVGGPFGPATLSDFTGGTNTTLGTQLETHTFPVSTTGNVGPLADVIGAPITADAHQFMITFTAPGQTATDTIQTIANIPEPASLALLGTALAGLGFFRFRRRRLN